LRQARATERDAVAHRGKYGARANEIGGYVPWEVNAPKRVKLGSELYLALTPAMTLTMVTAAESGWPPLAVPGTVPYSCGVHPSRPLLRVLATTCP
jgi:hypothetical protein